MPTPKYIRNTGKPWKPEDKKILKELSKENTPTRVAGLKLGRTPDAVYAMAQKLGVSLKPTNQKPYNRKSK